MSVSQATPIHGHWFSFLAGALDPRSAPRLIRLFLGALLARGRRTVTSWIRAARLSDQYRLCYTTLSAAGKRADGIAARLAYRVVEPLVATSSRLVFAIDDTPTPRDGPQVQGAGFHHNPTPGPAGGAFVYGHVFVVLGLLASHPHWGVTALPLLARLYIRRKDLASIEPKHRPAFRTKLEQAVELMEWALLWLKTSGKAFWVVVDGAYAKAPFLKAMMARGVTVVSRLRKDAALWTEPGPRRPGQRGRRRIYGEQRIDLAKRAGQSRGWTTETFHLYGKEVSKKYKTFRATWQPTGGVIPILDRDLLSRLQGNRRSGPATSALRGSQRRSVPPVPVDLHRDRSMGLEPRRRGVDRAPHDQPLGQGATPPQPRRQAPRLASGTPERGDSSRSTTRAQPSRIPSRRRTDPQFGHLRIENVPESAGKRNRPRKEYANEYPTHR